MDKLNLPIVKLKSGLEISDLFAEKGLGSFQECVSYIHQLPYGRNTDRGNFKSVFNDKKGTCSTKHALIKALADEQDISLSLVLGMFLTTPSYDARIKPILNKFKLPGIPEAHSFLQYNECYFDITFPGEMVFPKESDIIEKYFITPEQIGKFKLKKHSEFINRWITENQLPHSEKQIWDIRESWIKFLSDNP